MALQISYAAFVWKMVEDQINGPLVDLTPFDRKYGFCPNPESLNTPSLCYNDYNFAKQSKLMDGSVIGTNMIQIRAMATYDMAYGALMVINNFFSPKGAKDNLQVVYKNQMVRLNNWSLKSGPINLGRSVKNQFTDFALGIGLNVSPVTFY